NSNEIINNLLNNIYTCIVRCTDNKIMSNNPDIITSNLANATKTEINNVNQGLYTYFCYLNNNSEINFMMEKNEGILENFLTIDELFKFMQDSPSSVNIQLLPFIMYDSSVTFRTITDSSNEITTLVMSIYDKTQNNIK